MTRLAWMAAYIRGQDVLMFGTRPPSARKEIIEEKNGHFEDGALVYKTHRNVYTALAIKRSDSQKLLSRLIEQTAEN